jgi:hypothetical protein
MDNKSLTVRVPRRWVRIAMIVGVTALVVAPLTAIASDSFTDVPDEHTFHDNIQWLKDTGVTKGCNPPANTEYCPERFTSRGEMAAFMQRYAQFIDAEDGTPGQADNADTLDGLHANDLVRAEGTSSADGLADSVVIEAPVDGQLVVNSVTEGTDADTWTCSIELDGAQAPDGFAITATGDGPCSNTVVLEVDAGDHTVDIAADPDTVNASSLSVVFVPFNGAGE